jgi:isoamylase
MVLPGDQIPEVDEHGERILGDSFAILFNAHHEAQSFRPGTRRRDVRWTCVLDTATSDARSRIFEHMSKFPLQARSLAVLRAEFPSVPTTT